MHIDIYVALAGLIVGFAVGLTGMGGGALMTPVLVLLFNIQPLAAVSSDLVASLVMKPVGVVVHIRQRTVRWPLVAWLSIGSLPGAFGGVVVLRVFLHGSAVQTVIQLTLGAVLLVAVAALIAKTLIDRRRGAPSPDAAETPIAVHRAATALVGAGVGFIVGITSVGSGSLVIAILLFLYPRLRGSQLVGTDLTQSIPMVGSAALAHIVFGDFTLPLTAAIILGSVPGVFLGSLISSRARTGVLRPVLCVVLLASGLRLVTVPAAVIGIVLAVSIIALLAAWLISRSGGWSSITRREASARTPDLA